MEEVKKRVRRSKDEITQAKIESLEAKKAEYVKKVADIDRELEALRNPKPTVKMKDIRNKIDELDLDYEEVMKALEKMGKK